MMKTAGIAFKIDLTLTVCVLLCLPNAVRPQDGDDYETIRDEISIYFSQVLHICTQKFLSLAIGFGVIVSNFRGFDFRYTSDSPMGQRRHLGWCHPARCTSWCHPVTNYPIDLQTVCPCQIAGTYRMLHFTPLEMVSPGAVRTPLVTPL